MSFAQVLHSLFVHNHHLLSALRRQIKAVSTCLVNILPTDGVITSFMKPHTLLRVASASSDENDAEVVKVRKFLCANLLSFLSMIKASLATLCAQIVVIEQSNKTPEPL